MDASEHDFDDFGPVVHTLAQPMYPLEAAHRGKKNHGAQHFLDQVRGWTDANHYDGTIEMLAVRRAKLDKENTDWRIHRDGWIRARKQAAYEAELDELCGEAVNRQDFNEVFRLWDLGAGCQAENNYGHTALTMASAVESMVVNGDGQYVPAIALLLDREKARPDLNFETRNNMTALTWAAKNGRTSALQFLIDRGANINYVCRDGKSALLHAAIAGQWLTVRLLLERGADPFQRGNDGKTAVEYALSRNLVGVARAINAARAGFVGNAKGNRGKALEVYPCGLGCGRLMPKEEIVEHENNDCPKRIVDCRLGCGIKGMWAEERQAHEEKECRKRRVKCALFCSEMVPEDEMSSHCLKCGYGCGVELPMPEMDDHKANDCVKRIVVCPKCPKKMRFENVEEHVRNECKKAQMYCRLGCQQLVIRGKRATHERRCPMRIVQCSFGCGYETREKDIHLHENYHCAIERGIQHRQNMGTGKSKSTGVGQAKNVLGPPKSAHVVKVCIVGVAGSGKTALLNRFISNTFQVQPDEHGAPHVGFKFVKLANMPPVWVEAWDLPRRSEWNQRDTGDRRTVETSFNAFSSHTHGLTSIMAESEGHDSCLICVSAQDFAVGSATDALEGLKKDVQWLERRGSHKLSQLMVVTRCDEFSPGEFEDLIKPRVTAIAADMNIDFVTCSAKTNASVRLPFMYSVKRVLQMRMAVLANSYESEQKMHGTSWGRLRRGVQA
eukprot:g2908.t1